MILFGKLAGEIGFLKEVFVAEGYGVISVKDEDVKISFNFFSRVDKEWLFQHLSNFNRYS